ncbi:hypothetical protein ERX46_10160 [Brumimicrobium glaciale]|uniref:Uncharacterized protein n=1 Tax=Brumimicrobium glaciale TaxID=200475 RepID=A0A4Q4KN08_9FLAO|nr:hypothetical protein [Brumimicrobium glaciale]RYM33299.1 hypothetical protein ERX46_10160 [Brumimicrobium glaciale]
METKRKIEHFDEASPLSLFYEFGLHPNEIKESIIDTFSPYFENKQNLERYAVSDFVNNWLSYLSVYRDSPDSLRFIKSILDIFNGAKKVNLNQTIEAYAFWFPEISQSISRFWSLNNSQVNLNELCIEDFLEEAMNMIGQTIEGLTKVFFKLLLQLNRIKRGKSFDVNEIKSKDLGEAIEELINTSDLKELLIIEPHAIRLNQWRNIAYHHNTKIVNKEIICSFKKKEQIFEFKITRDELIDSLKRISLSFKLIRIAESIFCFDNLNDVQLQVSKIDKSTINIREEAKLLDFYSAIGSQGFKIIDLEVCEDNSILKLQDMQPYSDFSKRGIHTSQFLYNLWIYSNSSSLVIEYHLPNGEKFLASEISSDNFKNHAKTNSLSELLKEVKFTPFIIDYQNKNPFESLALTKELNKYKSDFRSQRGEKICLKEFIKQFTLSVFSNYLVLRSEDFSENDISINIGNDGSMAIGDNKNGKIVLHVPAMIREKNIQKLIISLRLTW